MPLLADFSVRIACGLAALLLLTPVREVPPKFFQTHCLVILGLLVLAVCPDLSASGGGELAWWAVVSGGLAYLAAVVDWDCSRVAAADGPGDSDRGSRPRVGIAAGDRAKPSERNERRGALGVGFPLGARALGDAPGTLLSDGSGHVDRAFEEVRALHWLGAGRPSARRGSGMVDLATRRRDRRFSGGDHLTVLLLVALGDRDCGHCGRDRFGLEDGSDPLDPIGKTGSSTPNS